MFISNQAFELSHKEDRVNKDNLLGFLIIFSIFMSGLCANVIIAGKVGNFLGFIVPSSVFVWALTFPLTDIVSEVYGFKYARRMVVGCFFGFLAVYLFMYLSVILPPAPFWDRQDEYEMFFLTGGRVILGAICSYAIVQTFDVYAFAYLKKVTKGKYLWLRNNVSTLLSQTLSNTIFLTIAFAGIFEWSHWWALFVGNLSMRYILAFSDTIIVYSGVYLLYKFYPELRD